jgi:hypothetical protein
MLAACNASGNHGFALKKWPNLPFVDYAFIIVFQYVLRQLFWNNVGKFGPSFPLGIAQCENLDLFGGRVFPGTEPGNSSIGNGDWVSYPDHDKLPDYCTLYTDIVSVSCLLKKLKSEAVPAGEQLLYRCICRIGTPTPHIPTHKRLFLCYNG